MKTRLGLIIGCITLFLFVAVQPVSASHLCGQDCNQFTDQGACTHGCTVPGANPNPDMRNENDYRNAETQQAQQNAAASNAATAAIVIQQAVAAGVEASIAVQVLETQYGVTNARDALKAVEQLNAAADAAIASGTVQTGCQGAGCCLINNCGSGQYCAGADAGRNQYGRCVEGDNKPRSGTDIARAFIEAGGSATAVTSNPQAFFGEKDYDAMQGKNGQEVKSLESIVNGIKGVVSTGTTAQSNAAAQSVPDDINCKLDARKCTSGCSYPCGNPTDSVYFCGDRLAKETKTDGKFLKCNEQILLYGGTILYAQSKDGMDCDDLGSGKTRCYTRPIDDRFGWNGTCFKNSPDAQYSSNLCTDPSQYANGKACNNQVSASRCLDPSVCGLQQLDMCIWTSATENLCAYVSMLTPNSSCKPVIPTVAVIPHVQPSFRPPTTSSTPPSSPTPPPSPPPPGSPVCLGETSSISAPTLGQSPVFTCTPASQATRYEFQWKLGSGAYQSLAPSASGSNVSSPLLVNSSGTYTVQCRPCNASGCANFDNI